MTLQGTFENLCVSKNSQSISSTLDVVYEMTLQRTFENRYVSRNSSRLLGKPQTAIDMRPRW